MGSHSRLHKLLGLAAIAVTVATIGLVPVATPAAAAVPTGSISVTPTNWVGGAAATTGCVAAYVAPNLVDAIVTDCSATAGVYTLGGLPGGDYRLRFTGFTGVASDQFYAPAGALGTPGAVTVVPGSDVPVAYALLPAGAITGKVIDTAAAAISGVTVTAYQSSSYGVISHSATAVTGSDGRFVITGLTAGEYFQLKYDPPLPYARESSEDALYGGGKSYTYYAQGVDGGYDATLTQGGAIAGTMAAPPGFIKDGNGCVFVYNYSDRLGPLGKVCGTLGAAFRFDHLHPGGYSVCIADSMTASGCDNFSTWYGAGYSVYSTDRTNVIVEDGKTASGGFVFGGTLKVAVTLDSGEPLSPGACLSSPQLAAIGAKTDCAPVGGVFSFTFNDDFENWPTFTLTNATNAKNVSYGGSHISVNAGATKQTSLEVPAAGTGSLTVTLARADGKYTRFQCVVLLLRTAGLDVQKGNDCDLDAGNVARFGSLPAGDYTLRADYVDGSYYSLTYPNGVNGSPGAPFHVNAAQALSLTWNVPLTQTLSGTVTDPDGHPVAGATVTLPTNSGPHTTTTTGPDGTYTVSGPIQESGLLVLGGNGLGQQWFVGSAGSQGATSLTGPWSLGDRHDVNVVLPHEARAQGTITRPGNATWARGCVVVVDRNALVAYGKQCGAVGASFDIGGLAPGSYRVCVAAEGSEGDCVASNDTFNFIDASNAITLAQGANLVPIKFGGVVRAAITNSIPAGAHPCAQLLAGAAVVSASCAVVGGHIDLPVAYDVGYGRLTVRVYGFPGLNDATASAPQVAGGRTAEVTLTALPWTYLRGTITRPAGSEGVEVCAEVFDGKDFDQSKCLLAGENTYGIPVPAGKYWVEFYSKGPEFAYQWFPNSPTFRAAAQVTVTPWANGTADATLQAGGRIAGQIRLADGSLATEGCAAAFDVNGDVAQEDCTAGDGSYALESMPTGTYMVQFTDVPGHAERWYNGAATYAGATSVTVVVGVTTTVNQTMAAAASLSGDVTLAGATVTGGCVEIVSLAGDHVTGECADGSGHYEIGDIPAGTFKILFTGFDGAADVWDGGAVSFTKGRTTTFTPGGAAIQDIDLAPGGTISGNARDDSGSEGDDYTVSLYELDGSLVDSIDVSGDAGSLAMPYSFDNVPAGKYKVSLARADDGYEWYYTTPQSLGAAVVTVSAGAWDVTGIDPWTNFFTANGSGDWSGRLNVPSSWTSPIVCAVAVTTAGAPLSADCGARGAEFNIPNIDAYPSGKRVVFTNGEVRTKAQFAAFAGTKIYYGNTSILSTAPAYLVSRYSNDYLPVWFFRDVSYKTPSFAAIQWMGDWGISTGYSDGTYRPTALVMRRDIATYLYKLAGSPKVTLPSKSPFVDVKAGATGYTAMVWMYQQSLWTSTTFGPTKAVTRSSLALILYRMAGRPAVALPSKSPYTDVGKSTTVTYRAIIWARNTGVMGAATGKLYQPNAYATRGLLAAGMYQWWWRYG